MEEHEHENYELFRRAILERDEQAWAEIHARFRSLLISWASHSSARLQSGSWCEDIADQALARAWAALTPDRFEEFATLARLLSYLRACVATTAIDSLRAQASLERALQAFEACPVPTPEQVVLAEYDRAALWKTVFALAATRAERIILIENFVYGLPPRTILERHPQIFSTITAVYCTKRNLFARLQRNGSLLELCHNFTVV